MVYQMNKNREHRAECNLIRDPIDECNINVIETEEVLKKYVLPEERYKIQDNYLYTTMPIQKDNGYVRVAEICKNSKIYCADENELYNLDKKLNKLGYKTRVGRNMYTGGLSIAVLEEPSTKGE